MTNRIILAILAGAAAASAASAQKILMTEFGTDSIYRLNLDNSIDNLYTFSDPDNTRLACITRGPDGAFYVANGPTPINDPSQSNIFRLTGLLGGVPNATVFAQSDPLQNPVGLVYDAPTNNFLAANNPVGAMSQQPFAGIVGIDATTGALTEVYPPTTTPPPPPGAASASSATRPPPEPTSSPASTAAPTTPATPAMRTTAPPSGASRSTTPSTAPSTSSPT